MYFFLDLCLKKYNITIFAKQSVANFRVCASNFPLLFLIAFDSGVLFCCLTLIVLYGHFILKHSIFSSSFVVNLFVLESQSNTLLTIGSFFFFRDIIHFFFQMISLIFIAVVTSFLLSLSYFPRSFAIIFAIYLCVSLSFLHLFLLCTILPVVFAWLFHWPSASLCQDFLAPLIFTLLYYSERFLAFLFHHHVEILLNILFVLSCNGIENA